MDNYYSVVDVEDGDEDDLYDNAELQNVNITTALLSTLSPPGSKRPLSQADDDSFATCRSVDSDEISSSDERYIRLDI